MASSRRSPASRDVTSSDVRHVRQFHPPTEFEMTTETVPCDVALLQSDRARLAGIRQCHDQLSEVVAGMLDDGQSPKTSTSQPTASPTRDGALKEQMNEIRSEVKRQSEGQEGLRQGQMELIEQVTELRSSVEDLCGDRNSLHHSATSTPSLVYRNRSWTNSSASFPNVFTPTSDSSDMSSANSFFGMSAGIERQRDELEACLSREMMKNFENHFGSMELQVHQLSEKLLQLKERVQRLWLLNSHNRPKSVRSSTSNPDSQALPPHIRAFCMNIEDVIHIRVEDLARYLCLSEEFNFKGGYSYRNDFWLVIREWSRQCHEKGSILLLETLLDACQKCGIENPLGVEPMPITDRRVLEQNYSYLAGHVMVPMVLTYLRDTGMLTNDLVRYVLEPEPRPERVTRLVDIITVFGKHALHLLKDSLRRSGQGHIADNLICREEALDPGVPLSALPNATVRLQESLKCQLKEINAPTEQVRRQHEVCQLPTGKIWSGLFLNIEISVKIPSHNVTSLRMLMEANLLRGLKHNHIIKLIGVSLQTDPHWIITESVKGSLLTHLRNLQEDSVSLSTILSMANQICSGMLYMECKGCIHGDLRAENVLMTDNRTLKVANFHIRTPDDNSMSNYTRWSSPETLKQGVTSIKTDVWAFGVLLWELVTLGLVPYPDMGISEMADQVETGYIMPRSHTQLHLPDYVYDVMTTCWKYFASERPSFAHLNSLLSGTRSKTAHSRETSGIRSDKSPRSANVDDRHASLRHRKSLPRDRGRRDPGSLTKVYVDDSEIQREPKKKKNLWQRLKLKKKYYYNL